MERRPTLFEEARVQMDALPRPVNWWMRWMNIIFLLGFLFISKHEAVGWVLAAYFVCFPAAIPFLYYTRDITMSGVPHIFFWSPLLVSLPFQAAVDPDFVLMSAYGIWTGALLLTVAISVLFDVRAVITYFSSARKVRSSSVE